MEQRLKIVHAGKFYPPARGGIETVVEQLCAGTVNRWDVKAVVSNEATLTRRERLNAVDVERVGMLGRLASVPICPTLPLHLWKGKYDCAILHEPNPVAAAALVLRTPAKRLIVWHHSDLVRPSWALASYRRVQRQIYSRADCVIVSSPPMMHGSQVVRDARRIEVIPYGIETQPYECEDEVARGRVAAVTRSFAAPRLIFVGRLVYYKGLHVLIRALAQCRGTLRVVGHGPLEGSLKELAKQMGVADRVFFLQGLSNADVAAHYSASDVAILPSVARTEAFGIAQLEAMASGVPVISTDLPTGVPWVNQSGVTGLVVRPNDAAALAIAVSTLTASQELRERMGVAARTRVRDEFSTRLMIQRFVSVVESLF